MSLKITKSKSSKMWPRLIIIEGFWRIGKSTLIKELTKKEQFILINEPNHLIGVSNVKDPHQWYFKKHLERQSLARELMKNGKKVIMERSILSNIAFEYAEQGKITKESEKIIKNLQELKQFPVIFLYAGKQFVKNTIQKLKDDFVKNSIVKTKKFYSNYVNFYKNILSEATKNNTLCLNVAPEEKFLDPRVLVKKLEIKIRQSNKERVKEICAAAILVYNNKVLLLHDQSWDHYVLPQGHKEAGENLRQTAIREAKEETGYSELKLIKKIKRYQYNYSKGNRIIYKTIHVYLIRTLSLASHGKKLDEHENYANRFFSFREAMRRARWPQDKELIALSHNYLKK